MKRHPERTILSLATIALIAVVSVAAQNAPKSQAGGVPNLANEIAALQAQVAALQPNPKLLFTEHDRVVALDPVSGVGALSGVVTGRVTGTSTLNFALTPTSPFNYTFDGRTGITDVDGDQLILRDTGTGRFQQPLLDPTVGGNPGAAPFQVLATALGGGSRVAGTCEVVATSGKYVALLPIGHQLDFRAIVTYVLPSPPTAAGTLGSAYLEVFER